MLRGYTGSEKEHWFLGSGSFRTKPCTWSEKITAFFHDQQGQSAIPFPNCLPKSWSGDTPLSFQGARMSILENVAEYLSLIFQH